MFLDGRGVAGLWEVNVEGFGCTVQSLRLIRFRAQHLVFRGKRSGAIFFCSVYHAQGALDRSREKPGAMHQCRRV